MRAWSSHREAAARIAAASSAIRRVVVCMTDSGLRPTAEAWLYAPVRARWALNGCADVSIRASRWTPPRVQNEAMDSNETKASPYVIDSLARDWTSLFVRETRRSVKLRSA
jgi:hypothetical protein